MTTNDVCMKNRSQRQFSALYLTFIFLVACITKGLAGLQQQLRLNNSGHFENFSSFHRRTTTTISPASESALCALIAATTVTETSNLWQCYANGTVTSQPCNGNTGIWPGITCLNGDVVGIYSSGRVVTGQDLQNLF